MTITNLIPYLMAFEETPTFIVSSSIQALLIARGMPDLIIPSVEQKTYGEWEKTIALLTPEEIEIISDIVELLRDPEALKQILSTSTIKEITYLLNKDEVKSETTPEAKVAKITKLLNDPEIVKELSKIPGTTYSAKLAETIKKEAGYSIVSGTTDTAKLVETIKKEAAYAKGIVRLNTILFRNLPKLKTLAEIEDEREAQIRAYNKQLEEQYQKRQKEIEEEQKPEPIIKKPKPTEKKKPTIKEGLKITRIDYPKWWKDSLTAKIDLTAPESKTLATVSGKLRLYVATIVITVTGETQITITFGEAGSSGPIYLGGTNQPMGIVIAMGNSPAPCGAGNLVITATDPSEENTSVGGWATCFVEEEN